MSTLDRPAESPRPSPPPSEATPTFQFAGGEPAPPQLAQEWACYQALVPPAQNSLWELLQMLLRQAESESVQQRADAFCQLYSVTLEDVDLSLRAVQYLVAQSARFDLSQDALRQDLMAFGPDARGVDALLLYFDDAKQLVRNGIVQSTLLNHGEVFVGVDWRVDTMVASNHGEGLSMPVVTMSFRHQHGETRNVTSLQLTHPALRELLSVCARIDQGLRSAKPREEA